MKGGNFARLFLLGKQEVFRKFLPERFYKK